ncbi:MAG: hypothetical protein AAF253_05770 [Pseudomonadota bacterium]
MTRLRPAFGLILLAGTMSGCGLTGDLQRPDPLFGDPVDRGAAQLPDRDVERGLPETPQNDDDESGNADDLPDADNELLGGPGAG